MRFCICQWKQSNSLTTQVKSSANIRLVYDNCLPRCEGSREEKAYQFNITSNLPSSVGSFKIWVSNIQQDNVCLPFTINKLLTLQTDYLLQIILSSVTPWSVVDRTCCLHLHSFEMLLSTYPTHCSTLYCHGWGHLKVPLSDGLFWN
jgi:hypothetical protein